MVPTSSRALLRAPWWPLALLCVLAPGCIAEPVTEEAREMLCADTPCDESLARAGEDPATFCDDDNPCTEDTNCTPCSALPPSLRDIRHCTADDDLPPHCAGRAGCVHTPRTTPAGQRNDCFPVADADEARAGSCRAGVCVENAP